ncbi:MAG: hypothetical protein HC830_13745 [Bacteroidetes bacterium]|nr:hypothetical protein [Bacteroidota bacterium]
MSREKFELKKSIIEAIGPKEVIEPSIPIAVALQEGEDLLEWCKPDRDALVKAGLDWSLVEDLSNRIGACRYAQSIWQKEFNSMGDARKEWQKLSPHAYDLRNVLLHNFFHALP